MSDASALPADEPDCAAGGGRPQVNGCLDARAYARTAESAARALTGPRRTNFYLCRHCCSIYLGKPSAYDRCFDSVRFCSVAAAFQQSLAAAWSSML